MFVRKISGLTIRCEWKRQNEQNRLTCTFVDGVGCELMFDELVRKEIIRNMRRGVKDRVLKTDRDILIYEREKVVKVLYKERGGGRGGKIV